MQKGAVFLVMGMIMYRVGSVRIDAMRGLGKRMPWTMAAFVIGGLSLIGVPGTVGFISKWYLVLGAVQGGHWVVAAFILIGSLLAVVYVWRVVEVAYFQEFVGEMRVRPAPLSMLIPTWIMVGAFLYCGLYATLRAGVATRAAEILLGVSP